MAELFSKMRPVLDERQRRVLAGVTARALGRGGVAQVASVSGMSRKTVSAAVAEVDAGIEPSARVRRPGAGRKKLVEHDRELLVALDALVEPESRGDPMCRLRWTVKSTRTLAEELTRQGHPVSSWTVAQLLHYHHRLPLPAGNIEAQQQDRAPAVLRHHQQLAWPAAGQP